MDKKNLTKMLSFVALTDGCLSVHRGCVNASFSLSMKRENQDFVDMCGSLLDNVGVGWHVRDDGVYLWLSSRTHPFLTTLHQRLYMDGRKFPEPHTFKLLDWESMAIMYMADGSIQRSGQVWYPMLNLCRWNYAELTWVKHQIKERLGVDANVMKCGKYWRLGFGRASVDRFFDGVRHHMLPSFFYKLPDGKPRPIGNIVPGGEIV